MPECARPQKEPNTGVDDKPQGHNTQHWAQHHANKEACPRLFVPIAEVLAAIQIEGHADRRQHERDEEPGVQQIPGKPLVGGCIIRRHRPTPEQLSFRENQIGYSRDHSYAQYTADAGRIQAWLRRSRGSHGRDDNDLDLHHFANLWELGMDLLAGGVMIDARQVDRKT